MNQHPRFLALALPVLALVATATPAAAQTLYGPTPYLSSADSPFTSLGGFSYFHLENFQDAALTPGWTHNPGWAQGNGSVFTDSVDADDGVIDGTGVNGGSFYSGGANSVLSIDFNAAVLGQLPTHVGLVWTDVGNVFTGIAGIGPVRFEAFDSASVSLGVIDIAALGDGSALSSTAEDRFFGVFYAGGISRITMAMSNSPDWEVDHLQYGFQRPSTAVPEPSTFGVLGAGILGALLARRRRRNAAATVR